jgi:hypothetical protein
MVGCTIEVETAMVAIPTFVGSCVEIASMVADPEAGAVAGAV